MNHHERGVIDFRQHKFIQVTKAVIDDTEHFPKPVEKLVYVVLCSYADNKNKDSWPSISTIADRSSCSEDTARRAIKSLVESGVIEVKERYNSEGRQLSNRYIIVDLPANFGDRVAKT